MGSRVKILCMACAGRGKRPEEKTTKGGKTVIVRERCRACKGSGRVVKSF